MINLFISKIIGILEHILPPRLSIKFIQIKIGQNNFIASKFWSSEPYLIEIGSNCQITSGVKILTHGGANIVRHIEPNFDVFGKVTIGNYVYIGTNSLIMPGVTIADHVLIAAGSVVTKSIPANCVVGGNPAKYICSLTEYFERNKSFDFKSKNISPKNKRKLLLNSSDKHFLKKKFISINL